MKILFFVWIFLALCVGATAQPRGPLPLRPAFINWKGNPGTAALDTIAHPGTVQIPCRVAYMEPYVVFVSGRGEVIVSRAAGDHSNPVFAPTNSFDLADVPHCSSIYSNKIVFVSITDGYLQPKRYTVVELSLARETFVRPYRSRTPVCASYSADGTHILVESQGHQHTVPSAY